MTHNHEIQPIGRGRTGMTRGDARASKRQP
jgi:hypothetical protein